MEDEQEGIGKCLNAYDPKLESLMREKQTADHGKD